MLHNRLKIVLLAVVTSSFNASAPASSSTTCMTSLSKQKLIKKFNNPMYLVGDFSWPERKEVISKLILSHNMHPDTIMRNWNTPLYDATLFNDLEFTEFLLKHNANPNTQSDKKTHILFNARTVAMATLLFKYGAKLDQESCENIVHNTVIYKHDPALIPLYVQHGAQINQQDNDDGCTPLIRAITLIKYSHAQYISPLLQYGALITPKVTKYQWRGYNAPMIIKKMLDKASEQNNSYLIKEYQQARNILKNHYETTQHMLPINDYLVESEKSYQNLEKIPAELVVRIEAELYTPETRISYANFF